MRTIAAFLLLVPCLLTACGADDEGASPTDPPLTTVDEGAADRVEQLADDEVADAAPGTVRAVLGQTLDATLEIRSCTIDPAAASEDGTPAELVVVDAAGTGEDGRAVELAIRRFRTVGVEATITDTITVVVGDPDSPEVAVVAQRFEVGGRVTDPRDPGQDDPLLTVTGDRIEAQGRFGPPGAFADDGGLLEGVVVARCA